jgi:hypothetical protein
MIDDDDSIFTFKEIHAGRVEVYLGNNMVGNIIKLGEKYQYRPSSSRHKGELFDNLDDLKRHLNGL